MALERGTRTRAAATPAIHVAGRVVARLAVNTLLTALGIVVTLYTEVDAEEVEELTVGYDDPTEFLVDKVAQGVGTLAAAFWPRPVILRFSDFKTNEYASMLGGAGFEPESTTSRFKWDLGLGYYEEIRDSGTNFFFEWLPAGEYTLSTDTLSSV